MKILVIDDDEEILESIESVLVPENYMPVLRKNSNDIIKLLKKGIRIVVLDVSLQIENGIQILKNIVKFNPNIKVIMISGTSDIEIAVKAIKTGAYDFIEKPFSRSKFLVTISNAAKIIQAEEAGIRVKNSLKCQYNIIGNSVKIEQVKQEIEKIAPKNISVLINGENGTGKELVAGLIHFSSGRYSGPYVKINCAALPANLVESELFGYKKGAFTGAEKNKTGLFEQAHKGTIFLDEICEMDIKLQAKLLRVLQEKEIKPLGDTNPISIDVRIICATNRNIHDEIRKGNFRQDLYYRIAEYEMNVPPLRERREDIKTLAEYFINKFCNENNVKLKTLSEQALDKLTRFDYPGNIRELKNIIFRGIINSEDLTLTEHDFDLNQVSGRQNIFETKLPLKEMKKELEKKYIQTQIKLHNNDLKQCAKTLDIHINNFYRKLNELDIN